MFKQQKGMTLTMLVLSIVGMLALAAVAIAMVLDELSYDPEPIQVNSEPQVVVTESSNIETSLPVTENSEMQEITE